MAYRNMSSVGSIVTLQSRIRITNHNQDIKCAKKKCFRVLLYRVRKQNLSRKFNITVCF
jgi:hypothetical protein